jgi:hypothetical protein
MKGAAEIPFEEAVSGLRELMRSCGVSDEIVWLFREDILTTGGEYGPPDYHFKNINQSIGKEEQARRYYKPGQDKGLGVCLRAFISLGDKVGCWVEIPEDELDGEYKMIPVWGLKYSCVENMQEAAIVKNPIKWWLLRAISDSRKDGWLADLPSKYSSSR